MVGVTIRNMTCVAFGITAEDNESRFRVFNVFETTKANFLLNVVPFEFFFDVFCGDDFGRSSRFGFPISKVLPRFGQFAAGDDQDFGARQ